MEVSSSIPAMTMATSPIGVGFPSSKNCMPAPPVIDFSSIMESNEFMLRLVSLFLGSILSALL